MLKFIFVLYFDILLQHQITIKTNIMKAKISKRGENTKVNGQFFVTYSAERNGKKYITTHLNPCGGVGDISADELNIEWQKRYKGLCPFNGDQSFEVLKIQQRF